MATDSFQGPAIATGSFPVAPSISGPAVATGAFTLQTNYASFSGSVKVKSSFSADSGDLANGRYRR